MMECLSIISEGRAECNRQSRNGHFKQQNYVALCHHQWKTPLAVRPAQQANAKTVSIMQEGAENGSS
jgi:hypothetical protein